VITDPFLILSFFMAQDFYICILMYRIIFLLLIFISSCTLPEEKKESSVPLRSDTTVIQSNDVNTASIDTLTSIHLPAIQKIKSPDGIYQTILASKEKPEQTILFNSDLTYQLQESYKGKKDSIITTAGNWAPSDGFIWLYKDQVVRGRYKWKGDTLQYYSPLLKKGFSMNHLQDATQSAAWRNKVKEGVVAFGMGNEPFWTIEYDNKDTVSFLLSEWDHPLKIKASSAFNTNDSTGYIAQNDSVQIRVTIFPHFCSDGMSDLTYRNRIRVQYNQQVYNGCGILYQQ
jgi:uncharacterized membrane protein